MDGATVTREWSKEFYRLRGKVFIDQELEAKEAAKLTGEWDHTIYNDSYIDEYVYRNMIASYPDEDKTEFAPLSELVRKGIKSDLIAASFKISLGTKHARSVQLGGSFDGWKSIHTLAYDQYTNCWFATLHLKKGKYL